MRTEQRIFRDTVPLADDRVCPVCDRRMLSGQTSISGDCPLLPDDRVVALWRALYPRGQGGRRAAKPQTRELVPFPDDRVVALWRALYPGGQEGGRSNLNLVRLPLYLMTGL
jgi:hypothetical protein